MKLPFVKSDTNLSSIVAANCCYNACMTTIVIRDVPPEVHDVLVKRAASEGRSLQQYTLRMISEAALRKTQAEVLAEIRRRAHRHPEISNEQIVAGIRADREGVDDPWH